MGNLIDCVTALLLITDLMLLGSSFLSSSIRIVALQGVAVGLLPLLMHEGGPLWRPIILSIAIMSLKGGVFPLVLSRVMREANVRREVEPFVGTTLSIIFGVLALVLSMWLASRLRLSAMIPRSLVIPSGLATMFIGLFVIVSRRKALTQVLGYIVMENGIYALGVALAGGVPLLVELGVLLDAFVAVFIMSIAAYHINREFDHLDVDQLDSLKD